jgi:hypothetical protein
MSLSLSLLCSLPTQSVIIISLCPFCSLPTHSSHIYFPLSLMFTSHIFSHTYFPVLSVHFTHILLILISLFPFCSLPSHSSRTYFHLSLLSLCSSTVSFPPFSSILTILLFLYGCSRADGGKITCKGTLIATRRRRQIAKILVVDGPKKSYVSF